MKLMPIHVAGLAIAASLLNLAIHWPGALTPDSTNQLLQATSGRFNDWHPPIMAMLWRLQLGFEPVTVPMLTLQIALHWLGIGLFATALCRKGHHKSTLVMLTSGFTPLALHYTGIILKDSLLTSFLIAGFGFAVWHDFRMRGIGLLIGLVGMLIRANAVFAVSPLIYLALRLERWTLLKAISVSAIVSIALIPVSQWINHDLLQAERTGVERSLQLYDLIGIAHFSGDTSELPVSIHDLRECYTPLFWDTLKTQRCDVAFERIGPDISRNWITSIATHPAAYITHRLTHFNREIFFLVPFSQQCVEAPEFHSCPVNLTSDILRNNGLLWPVTWLTLGCVMLLLGLGEIPRALCISGLLYGFAYLFVGVASDFRYFYWTALSIQTALIVQIATAEFPKWRITAVAVLIVWIVGYAWRIAKFMP